MMMPVLIRRDDGLISSGRTRIKCAVVMSAHERVTSAVGIGKDPAAGQDEGLHAVRGDWLDGLVCGCTDPTTVKGFSGRHTPLLLHLLD